MNNIWKYSIVTLLIFAFAFSRVLVFYKKSDDNIRDVVYEKDIDNINALFHQGENWYWLISDFNKNNYSVDFMLRYKTSSQHDRLFDLIAKALEVDGNIAGFIAYYPKSLYTWQLLFVVVNEEYRGKGLAKKLVRYAVNDMLSRGMLKIDMVTRPVNERARALYRQLGFKELGEDKNFVYLTWHKGWDLN